MTWYLDCGFQENPFSIKSNPNLVGIEHQRKKLIDYIKSGDICFLNGPTGTGKSSLLKWLHENLKDYKPIYIDAAEVDDKFTVTKVLKHNLSIWEKLANKKFPEKVVILLDESQDASNELVKALKLHWDHNHIKSIIITQISPDLGNYSVSFRDRIGNRVIKLGQITKSEAFELIKLRIKNKKIFDEASLEKIFNYSNFIPRKILETCEIICIEKKDSHKKTFTSKDIDEFLSRFKETKKEIPIEKPKENKIEMPDNFDEKSFSPMQQKIVTYLAESPKTAKQLSSLLNTSEGSVGKQLSKLSHLDVVKIISKKRPKRYGLIKE
mgnify:CR=1 FL=1